MSTDWRRPVGWLLCLVGCLALLRLATLGPRFELQPTPPSPLTTLPLALPSAADLKLHFPRTSRRLPQAIIIGVRKCGTRALLEMLYLHPGVQKAAGEVHFFDRDENYRRGLDWYRKKMPHSFRGQVTIEKSPSYFVTPEVPERIRAMNASVKLLLIVREPVTRAVSDYTQLRSHATSSPPSPPFEQLALRPDGTVNAAYRPLALSLYHNYIHRWLEVFPRQQLLVVNGDRLIEDPVSELEKIEAFLGLEHRIGRHNFYFNRTKGFYCLRNDTADKCLRESKGRRHPHIHPAVLSKLRTFYLQHNQKFYELIVKNSISKPQKISDLQLSLSEYLDHIDPRGPLVNVVEN